MERLETGTRLAAGHTCVTGHLVIPRPKNTNKYIDRILAQSTTLSCTVKNMERTKRRHKLGQNSKRNSKATETQINTETRANSWASGWHTALRPAPNRPTQPPVGRVSTLSTVLPHRPSDRRPSFRLQSEIKSSPRVCSGFGNFTTCSCLNRGRLIT